MERAHLCQRVIDIIEGVKEDMLFLHPETAFLKERIAVIIAPWHVFFLDGSPDMSALHR